MSEVRFNGVKIRGVAAAVPEKLRTVKDDMAIFGEQEVLKISESTGVKQRHVTTTLCASDLFCAAAARLLEASETKPEEINALIVITQLPDYKLPATACILQDRLGLPKTCAAFDINLGCSGYAYGLWMVSGLISSGAIKKALLLVGDTSYVSCSPQDRSVSLLFGDAGSATLLEASDTASPAYYVLGTDGSGKDHLILKAGGARLPFTPDALTRVECEGGNKRSPSDLYMNGAEIFAFTLKSVPPLIKSVLSGAGKDMDGVDYFVFHQANKFMLEHLRKRIKIPPEKFVFGLENYGNTSSASIPMALVTELRDELQNKSLDLVLAGFGVGFSWSGVYLTLSNLIVPELVTVPEN